MHPLTQLVEGPRPAAAPPDPRGDLGPAVGDLVEDGCGGHRSIFEHVFDIVKPSRRTDLDGVEPDRTTPGGQRRTVTGRHDWSPRVGVPARLLARRSEAHNPADSQASSCTLTGAVTSQATARPAAHGAEGRWAMSAVIVLNTDNTALHTVSVKHAIKMLVREVAMVEESRVGASIGPYPWPVVLRLIRYVKTTFLYAAAPAWSKRGVLRRDPHRCAYCGTHGRHRRPPAPAVARRGEHLAEHGRRLHALQQRQGRPDPGRGGHAAAPDAARADLARGLPPADLSSGRPRRGRPTRRAGLRPGRPAPGGRVAGRAAPSAGLPLGVPRPEDRHGPTRAPTPTVERAHRHAR